MIALTFSRGGVLVAVLVVAPWMCALARLGRGARDPRRGRAARGGRPRGRLLAPGRDERRAVPLGPRPAPASCSGSPCSSARGVAALLSPACRRRSRSPRCAAPRSRCSPSWSPPRYRRRRDPRRLLVGLVHEPDAGGAAELARAPRRHRLELPLGVVEAGLAAAGRITRSPGRARARSPSRTSATAPRASTRRSSRTACRCSSCPRPASSGCCSSSSPVGLASSARPAPARAAARARARAAGVPRARAARHRLGLRRVQRAGVPDRRRVAARPASAPRPSVLRRARRRRGRCSPSCFSLLRSGSATTVGPGAGGRGGERRARDQLAKRARR